MAAKFPAELDGLISSVTLVLSSYVTLSTAVCLCVKWEREGTAEPDQ